jgi:hypothetical protein
MRKKWEYEYVHIDAATGFLLKNFGPSAMEEVFEAASTDQNGTYGQGEILRIAGEHGWELVCPVQDRTGLHWIFKREIEK